MNVQMRRAELPLCRKIEKSHAHSETSAPFWLLQEFRIFLLLLLFGNRLLDVRRFLHLLNFRLLRFLPGLKLRFEIVPFLLSDAFRTFHLPGYFRRASVLDGIKMVEAFLRFPVKPHAPIKRAFTLPEKSVRSKPPLHVAAVLLSGVVRFRA